MSSKESFFTDLDQTRDVLEAKAAGVERRVLRPAKSAFVQTASSYPLTTLFATTLLLLSIFPLVSFIGWCLFTGSIILFFTLVFFTVTASIVIGSAAVIFAATLAFAIAISIGVTIAAGVAVLAYRMLVNIKTSGSVISGSRASIDEVKQYFAAQPAIKGNGKHETLDAYVIKEEK